MDLFEHVGSCDLPKLSRWVLNADQHSASTHVGMLPSTDIRFAHILDHWFSHNYLTQTYST
jgi:hypothetical protein